MTRIKPLLFFSLAIALNGGDAVATEGAAPSCPVLTFDHARTLDLAQPKGKAAYVDFWASWCAPCAASFSFMNELHKELQAQGLEIIAVNLDENADDAANFLKKYPAEFTVAADPEGKCPALYEVTAMPTSYLIDRHGNIRHVHLGFHEGDKAEIRRQIQALLSEH